MPSAEDLRLRALRPPKPTVDPWRPIGAENEHELLPDGRLASSWTLFLAGRECPFTCVFCDLWRYTTDAPTPVGAIPEQIRRGLSTLADPREVDGPRIVKLYNASNFFDSGAVPRADDEEIARCVKDFDKVVVECHPKLVGKRCFDFAQRLEGELEVAMGFETAHPQAFQRLNKGAGLDDLRAASTALANAGVGLRAFLLLGVPFVPPTEELLWLQRSVELALECGASTVWLIPVRGGSQELRRLQESRELFPLDLDRIEEGYMHCRSLAPEAVRLDSWDLEQFADPQLDRDRLAALRRLQLSPDPAPHGAPGPEGVGG